MAFWGLTKNRAMRYIITLMLLCLSLGACDHDAVFNRFIPHPEAEEGKAIMALLAARDFSAVEQRVEPLLREPALRSKLQDVANQFPSGQPRSISTIGAHVLKSATDETYNLTYEYEFPSAWVVANVVLQRKAGELLVAGLQAQSLSQSQRAMNAFTFNAKGPIHYIFLILACAVPALIVVALVICIRTPIPRRKWLWCLFIALGFVQFTLNWTTGQWGVQPLSFMLLGAGFSQGSPYGPHMLMFSLPIGAIVFLLGRRSFRANAA